MWSDRRRIGLVTMLAGFVALGVTLVVQRGDDATVADTSPTVDEAAQTLATTTPQPTSTATPNPFAVATSDESVTITRLWSPEANTARAEGVITNDEIIATVVVDGVAMASVQLIDQGDGAFSIDITNLAPGPQEICLLDACQRVLVQEPGVEDRTVIESRIEQAILRADARFSITDHLAGWTIEVGGPNSSAGGSTRAQSRVMTINTNSGRSLDDYEITVLHEIGHAVDTQWMTDTSRQEFGALRGHDASLVWGLVDDFATGDQRWLNSAEDFAEVFVAWAMGGDYLIMTTAVAPQPSADQLLAFCELLAIDNLNCT